jgi:hypothetical protein
VSPDTRTKHNFLCLWRQVRARGLLVVLLVAIAACDDEQKPKPYVLKEVIDVQGTCSEDHVGEHDSYAGQIVRWQTVATGEVLAYGFVTKKGDMAEHIMDEVSHPTVYHTPQQIKFSDIDIDTTQPTWVLHGISDRGPPEEETKGYNSTCDLEVIKRGMEIRPPEC